MWLSLDRRRADLEDLFFNEPWFLVEGCLWALFGATAWRRSVVVACLLATAVGLLSGLGVVPTFSAG